MEKSRKKLVLRKISITKLTDDAAAALVGGPSSTGSCAPTAYCSANCSTACPSSPLDCGGVVDQDPLTSHC